MDELSVDIETYSAVDLGAAGVHVYADSPSTGIWCMAYAPAGQPVQMWHQGDPFPDAILDHLADGGKLRAWNAGFERNVLGRTGVRRYGMPKVLLQPDTWVCSMAEAAAMALPQGLARCAPAVSLPIAKDTAGSRVMKQLCQPRPSDGLLWRATDPGAAAKLAVLYAYCETDVEVERGIAARLQRLRPRERDLWLLTERINDAGVCIDNALCAAAQKIVDRAQIELAKELRVVTDFAIDAPSAVAQIKKWLGEQGVDTPDLDKAAVEALLARYDLPPKARRVLEIRQAAAKSSTAKLVTMMARQSRDGRCKGMLRYHGAATGRYSVAGLQIQNFPRPDPSIEVSEAIADVLTGDYDMVAALHGAPLNVVSSVLRGCLVPPPGEVMMSADLSQIELRMNAYLSGQADSVEGFRRYDAGTGPDAYVVAAAGIYGIPLAAVSKSLHRPVGKVAQLALGFMGGAGAMLKMSKVYGVDLAVVADNVRAAASADNIEKAAWAWKGRGMASGAPELVWVTAELIKLAFRDTNADIVRFAQGLEAAAQLAVYRPNIWVSVREQMQVEGRGATMPDAVHYRKSGSFLQCRLPSRRIIYYPDARLGDTATPWGLTKRAVIAKQETSAQHWRERALHGGLLIENVVQAAARDVMTDAMLAMSVERPEWALTLSIHDEVVGTCKKKVADLDAMCQIMSRQPEWLPHIPLAAAGWIGACFKKD